jgi:phosphatidylglycerophosphate synthase
VVNQSVGAPSPGKAKAKAVLGHVVDPVARGLLRLHVSADAVTIIGTIGASVGAIWLGSQGELLLAVLVVGVFALSDMLDGAMARQSGGGGPWGAFLDSTLDRITDASILAAIALWYLQGGDEPLTAYLALYCLVASQLISYTRARAESLGLRAAGGLAERTERLVVIGVATALAGAGVAYAQAAGMWVLAVATTITVLQRMWMVRRQTLGAQDRP